MKMSLGLEPTHSMHTYHYSSITIYRLCEQIVKSFNWYHAELMRKKWFRGIKSRHVA